MTPHEAAKSIPADRKETWRHYKYAGLRVASEIPLPEWTPFEAPSSAVAPEVLISLEDQSDGDPEDEGNRRVMTASEYQSFVPGIGRFRVRDGSQIMIAPVHGATSSQMRAFLTGSAWAALCYQRGAFLIHAGGALIGDSAVLFCARSKGGKSTMAAKLNACGYALVSDDLCNIEFPGPGRPIVYPASRRIKLWSDALAEIGWASENLEPDHARSGKFHALRSEGNMLQPVSVKAVYLLAWGESGIRRLSGVTALSHFLSAASYRRKLMQATGHMPRHVNGSLALLQNVPIWELRRPRDLATLGHTADMLADHSLSYD